MVKKLCVFFFIFLKLTWIDLNWPELTWIQVIYKLNIFTVSPRPTYLFTDKTVKLENYWDQSIIFRDPCTNINKIMLQKETERANELRLTFLRSKIILFIAICKIKILFIFCDPREILLSLNNYVLEIIFTSWVTWNLNFEWATKKHFYSHLTNKFIYWKGFINTYPKR